MEKEFRTTEKGELEVLVNEGKPVWRKAIWRECWYCGTKFPHPKHYTTSEAFKNRGRFCSRGCQGKHNLKRYAQNRATKRCPVCLGFFKIRQAHAERYKTCGRPECVLEFKKRTMLRVWQEKRDFQRLGMQRPREKS